MPRQAALEIKERKVAGKTVYWMTIPASLSPTGKRTRPQFNRKKKAELERDRILAMNKRFGHEAVKIPADVAADASRAMDKLKGYDVTLAQLANEYVERMKGREASMRLSQVWVEYQEHLERKTRGGHPVSEWTKKNTARGMKPLVKKFGRRLICEIEPKALRKALESSFKTAQYFNSAHSWVSPVFTFAVQQGYLRSNPMNQISKRDVAQYAISVATPKQIEKAIEACRDFRNNESVPENLRVDATNALAAVVIMAFAGVRPVGELGGLDWEQVDFDDAHIYITGKTAKARNARRIPMEDNLVAWLKSIPKAERKGPVRPANWKRKWQLIRKQAGLSADNDVLRHSFATYYHKVHTDPTALREALGHSTQQVLFNNYLNLHTKQKEAIAYWSIRPDGNQPQLKEVSA